MLHSHRKFLKAVSIFLMLNILSCALAPSLSYALTAGPTAPEATSFEPVDTTDMVNLLTGDLTYNLPLLEIPSPEGSYAMSLSYHAGIRPDEESSWVGLGWTLNAGAINRNVDGTPDDVNYGTVTQTRYTDLGSAQLQYVDIMGLKNASGTIYTAHNFEGNGGLGSLALVEGNSPDQTFSSSDASRGTEDDNMRNQVRAYLANSTLMVPYIVNNQIPAEASARMKVVPIPNIPDLYVDVKSNYWRWYKVQQGTLQNRGSLYASRHLYPNIQNSADAYRLISNATLMSESTDPDKYSYGLMPSNDSYNVSAQGLSGSIKPYNFENGTLFVENSSSTPTPDAYGLSSTLLYQFTKDFTKKVNFRFEGNFSNALSITPQRIQWGSSPLTGGSVSDQTVTANSTGYNSTTQQLAGSRHIDWYTLNQVNNNYAKTKGLMGYQNIDNQYIQSGGYRVRQFSPVDTSTIAAFKIVNEDGTTYHYALPAYAYGETYKIRAKGNDYNRIESVSNNEYAYEWLLTSITGSDYVDRNHNGLVDAADWGFWTAFDYGKWTDKYLWRTPATGYNTDIDGSNETATSGFKEIYYLDAVRTRTHTALFVKNIKPDGKGVGSKSGGYTYSIESVPRGAVCGGTGTIYDIFNILPVSTMKLEKIYVLNNDDLNSFLSSNSLSTTNLSALKANGNAYNHSYNGIAMCSTGPSAGPNYSNYHMGDNVLDNQDLTAAQFNLLQKSTLKTIQLNTDNSLCISDNSFTVGDDYCNELISSGLTYTRQGKLTLNSVKVYGKAGADLIPSYNFTYEQTTGLKSANFTMLTLATSTTSTVSFGSTPPTMTGGEVVKFTYGELDYYAAFGMVALDSSSMTYRATVQYFGPNLPTESMMLYTMNATETRNPPYDGQMQDIWGRFNSAYNKFYGDYNGNKQVTAASVNAQDLWNLREIETPTGAKIKITYEPDSYKAPEAFNNYGYSITSMVPVSGSNDDVRLWLTVNGSNLTDIFSVGSQCNFLALLETPPSSGTVYEELIDYSAEKAEIVAVNNSYITVRASGLANAFNGCYPADFSNYSGTGCANSFIGGRLKYYKNTTIPGGGIRVKTLAVEGSGWRKETNFKYESSPGVTSGVTSYEPYGLDVSNLSFSSVPTIATAERLKKQATGTDRYLKTLYANFANVLKLSRLLPAPGVMYEYVTVSQRTNNIDYPTSTRYQFEVFDSGMITIAQNPDWSVDPNHSNMYRRNYLNTIKNNTTRVGNLRSVFTYDKKGKVISKVIKKYLHDEYNDQASFEAALASRFSSQGKMAQSFNNYAVLTTYDASNNYNYYSYAITNLLEEYPSVLTCEESYDLLKGSSSKIQHLGYDFYSGISTKQFYQNTYGNYFLAKTIPAYNAYSEMGIKVNTPTNRHMLTQAFATYLYKADSSATILGTLSAEVNTWSKIWNYRAYSPGATSPYTYSAIADDPLTAQNEQIWRPFRSYVWDSPFTNADGTSQNFVDFDGASEANNIPQNQYWKRKSEISLYDAFSNPLEVKDINGVYASTKMGYKNTAVLANASNAKFTEMSYTGAEDLPLVNSPGNDYFDGEAFGNNYKSNTYAHSGTYSIKLSTTSQTVPVYRAQYTSTQQDFSKQKDYHLSVWVYKDNVTAANLSYRFYDFNTGTTISTASAAGNTSLPKAGDWYLLSLDFNLGNPTTTSAVLAINLNTTSSVPVYFDDFRFHPSSAAMTSYVYDPQSCQLTYILDQENFYTRFEYDPFGRLLSVNKETLDGEKKVNDYYYNYSRKP
ncbi:MAG TPA: hypothetical protein VNB90_01295 [Cytophagaceae bacterium]|nr:hypothetical protein [Cytophagaceae bacterium]